MEHFEECHLYYTGHSKRFGFISGLDQRLIDFYPQFRSDSNEAAVNRITLRHLLTMSSGLASGVATPDPGLIEKTIDLSRSVDLLGKFTYNNTDPAIVSMIIGKAANQKTLEFATGRLFKPLGISHFSWASRKDYPCGSTDLCLRPRDMAKIGYLYLNKGRWEGKQILSSEWIQESTMKQIEIQETVVPKPFTYGYFWWNYPVEGHYSYHAYGIGGQIIMVIPDLDIVFVTTSKNSDDGDSPLLYLPAKFVIKAIIK
jgi:CubicO group peptidase (beta-lactamase class C family)